MIRRGTVLFIKNAKCGHLHIGRITYRQFFEMLGHAVIIVQVVRRNTVVADVIGWVSR